MLQIGVVLESIMKPSQPKPEPMEFDFGAPAPAAPESTPASSKPSAPADPFKNSIPLEKDPTAFVIKGPPRPDHKTSATPTPSSRPAPEPETPRSSRPTARKTTPPQEPSRMNPTAPTPINARASIERQAREQKAVSTLLSGAALGLLGIILTLSALAAFGGYVLWHQIQKQGVTLQLVETNLRAELQRAQDELAANDNMLKTEIEKSNLLQTRLRSQTEEHRALIRTQDQTIATLQARNRQLEARVAELERRQDRLSRR